MDRNARGFGMIPHRLMLDLDGISPISYRLYGALIFLARGSGLVKGHKAEDIAGVIGIKPSTFRKCMKELEDGRYIARKNKQSRWFEVEFVPESDSLLATMVASKKDDYSPPTKQVDPDTRHVHSKYSPRTEQAVAITVATKANPLPISVFDKGIDKEEENKNISRKSGEGAKLPDPEKVAELIAWLPSVTDKPNVLKSLRLKAPLLAEKVARRRPEFAAVAAEWVKDVLTKACDKDNPITYCEAILDGWIEKGGRPGVELPGPDRTPPNRSHLKAGQTNQQTESEARSVRASRDSAEALRVARKACWESLGDDARKAVESQFDADNPKPAGIPPGIWATARLLGCMELMDKLRTHRSEAS